MGIMQTAVLYGIIGVAVSIAVVLRDQEIALDVAGVDRGGRGSLAALYSAAVRLTRRLALVALAILFWPIFVPMLLGTRATPDGSGSESTRIREMELQLIGALTRLDGVAEEILAPEVARVRGLSIALRGMARRLEEMDDLLEAPEFSAERARTTLADLESRGEMSDDPRRESVRARIKNIDRLRAMRQRTSDDLERSLLKMEELSSHMMLLKFAGRPEAEVVHMIKEIADSIEGVSEGLFEAA